MARVLILENDTVSAALIEDRLHVGGHRSILARDPVRLVSAASEGQADLIVLALELSEFSGLGVIRQLRDESATRSLPIVALSKNADSADRIAALRAGADDYLAKPFDVEELMLRIDRLLGHRGEASPVMKGDLASHPTWELAQYIQQAGKSGELAIHGARGSGQLKISRGKVVTARWQKLRGRDALLAMLDTKEGQFRLTTEDAAADAPSVGFAIQDVLMEAAWLDDELNKRQEHLPATGAFLRRQTGELPAIEDELQHLPMAQVFDRLGQSSELRLFDLVHESEAAPSKVRLAVAWLVEHGAVAAEDTANASSTMNTVEISSSMVLDLAIHNLLAAAREKGVETSPLSYLLLVEAGVQPQLLELFESEAGIKNHPALSRLVDELRRRQGGSADFATDFGTLSLHVQILAASDRTRIETILSECAGVLLWLDQAEDRDTIQSLVRRLEASSVESTGVLVTTRDAARLADGCRRWRVARHAPRSLIGVLRLLHPGSTS